MQVAVIAPYKYLELSDEGDILFLLAHRLQENEDYLNHAIKSKKYKLMDNGAFELDKSLDTTELVELAEHGPALLGDQIGQFASGVECSTVGFPKQTRG